MPKKLEQKLKREAAEKFPGDTERQDRYVYGALNRFESNHPYWRKRGRKAEKAKKAKEQ